MKVYKKVLLGIIGLVLVFSLVMSRQNVVQAGFPTSELASLPTALQMIWEKRGDIFRSIKNRIVNDLITRNLAYYMDTLAYNVANELATGGPGQTPLFRTASIGDQFQKANEAAIGNFIGELSEKEFADLGLNLCDPSLSVKLTISLSLIDSKAPPKPKCDWNQVQRNWQDFGDSFKEDILKVSINPSGSVDNFNDFFDSFSLSQSDFGAFMKISNELGVREELARQELESQIAECKGYKDKRTPITEEVIANCAKITTIDQAEYVKAVQADVTQQSGANQDSDSLRDNIGKIMSSAAKKFAYTFSAKLMDRWLKRGTWSVFGDDEGSGNSGDSGLRDSLLERLRGGSNIRQPRDSSIFRQTLTVDISQIDNFSLIDDFSICPPDPNFRHPDNCVIDTSLLAALNGRITVREAVDNGLIKGTMPFIGPEDQLRNLSDDCYLNALCHSNIVKLRKANIVPIGWELAALRSPITSPVTLQQVMDCFEDLETGDNDCEFDVSMDYAVDGEPHNPFYHLVDPNWVLKIPSAYCDAYVYSPVLEADSSSNRQQYCADVKTCLREDDQGNCLDGQYGYCTRSENIWRFDGEICQDGALYSGCLTFNNDQYGEMSYIEGTLDYCTNDQVGCRRYSQERAGDSSWVFQAIDSDNDDLFLNGATAKCSSEEAGCSEYIVMAPNTNANLLPNGDFEIDDNGDYRPDGFVGSALISEGEGANNSNAVRAVFLSTAPPHNITCLNNPKIVPNTNYTVSIGVKLSSTTPGTGPARISFDNCVDAGGGWGDIFSPDGSMEEANDEIPGFDPLTDAADEINLIVPVSEFSANGYTRITGTFNSGNSVSCGNICIGASYGNDQPHFFDNLKMEVVTNPKQLTTYSDYGVGATVYMNDDAFMCLAEEVGCMGYTPSNGDPMIPAVISRDDVCPAECVGYSTFAEQLTAFDIIEGLDSDNIEYHNFIPATALSCPIQEVGCEEFTNLDEVAQGGEGLEYYTNLRQCVMSDHAEADTFFTWEGSDVAGYQIKEWKILKSNEDDGPCTNYDADNDECNDDALPQAICGPETPGTIIDDSAFDPNCRQYFDINGSSYFRLQDRVIYASDACHEYRRTATGKLYRAISELSLSCQPQNNGCREYVGDTENNVRVVFSNNFEAGSYLPWENSPANSLRISSESLNLNGHSLQVPDIARRSFLEQGFRADREYQLSFWAKNTNALNSLIPIIHLQSGVPQVYLSMVDDDIDLDFYDIEAGNWHYYTTSLYIGSEDVAALNLDNLTTAEIIIAPGALGGLSPEIFIDNVVLKEVVSNTTVIRNSWQTPTSCDTPYSGYHLGCQAYTDNNGRNYNLRSFNYLCREEAIGCLPAIDTQNSTFPFSQQFNVGDVSQITVPADSLTYLVPDSANYCAANYKGCQALGLQNRLNPALSSTVYMINDPDRYGQILCDGDGLNCSEYTSSKGTYYFKDPSINTCTYKKNVNVLDTVVSGWFSNSSFNEDTGLAYGCSDTDQTWFDIDGFQFEDLEATSTMALTCPSNKNLCTGFRDINDPIGCDPDIRGDLEGLCSDEAHSSQIDCEIAGETWTAACEVYYYFDNNSIDEGSCNGQVDQNGGCILFYNENQWNAEHDEVVTLYDTEQTYNRNISLGYPLGPITCNPSFDPNCDLTSNRLIKVSKDRQCSEWLACKSSAAVYDPNTKSYRVICDELGSCLEYDEDNNVASCSRWAQSTNLPDPLSTEVYQQRATGNNDHMQWGDDEYTGYSVPFMLAVDKLEVYNFTDDEEVEYTRLAYPGWDRANGNYRYHTSCVNPADPNDTEAWDGLSCTMDIAGEEFTGECYIGNCWLVPNSRETSVEAFSKETRGYALANSPFPKDIEESTKRISGYSEATICEYDADANVTSCEGSFQKVTYGDGGQVRYYPLDADGKPPVDSDGNSVVMDGICLSGRVGMVPDYNNGEVLHEVDCTVDKQYKCNSYIFENGIRTSQRREDGMCQEKTKVETVHNWTGICLDYDYSKELIGENGEKRYYCNLWYPVNKIKGTNSLYDNYVEAGYRHPEGSDVLFCAVADPYILSQDRIYCGATTFNSYTEEVCSLLLRVPAGSRVHLSSLEVDQYRDLLSYGYLKTQTNNGEPVFMTVERDPDTSVFEAGLDFDPDVTYNDYEGLANRPRIYFERIERFDLPFNQDRTLEHFRLNDFVPPPGEFLDRIPILNPEQINDVFDGDVIYYFWDENVTETGGWNVNAKVLDPVHGFVAQWGPECDLNASPSAWRCGDEFTGPYSGHYIRSYTPGGDFHQVYTNTAGGNGSQGGVYDCRGGCGINKSKVCHQAACNPLSHGYYVRAQLNPVDAPATCSDTNCGFYYSAGNSDDLFGAGGPYTYPADWWNPIDTDWIMKGWQCLINNQPYPVPGYAGTYPTTFATMNGTPGMFGNSTSTRVQDFTSEDQCLGDPNCEYVYCINSQLNDLFYYQYGNPPTLTEQQQLACSDMGTIAGQDFEVREEYCEDSFGRPNCTVVDSWGFTNVSNITSCLDRLYDIEEASIFDHPDIDESNSNLNYPMANYNKAVPKEGVSEALINQLFGWSTWNGNTWVDQFPGCMTEIEHSDTPLAPDDLDPLEINCTSADAVPASCRYQYVNGSFVRTCSYYPQYILGTPCDTLSGCYYQCGVITELDAEGNNSWVRTDIWWRNEEEDQRVNTDWAVGYFSDLSETYEYPRFDNFYSNIESENLDIDFSHFGAAQAEADQGLVVTRVPLEGSVLNFGHARSYTYHYSTTASGTDLGDAWNSPSPEEPDAARSLVWLFARAYNLQWDGLGYVNPDTLGFGVDHIADLYADATALQFPGTTINPFAGPDYVPRIFKVCGEGYCENKDADGTLLEHEQGITINNVSRPEEGNSWIYIYGRGGTLFTAAKFYFHAHPDHMPIMNVGVDWTGLIDGTDDFNDSPGKYKNNLVRCGSDTLLPKVSGETQTEAGFGGLDRACSEGYKVLYHTYEYNPLYPCEGNQPGMPTIPDASCYQPLVQVQDRWDQGWWEAFDGWIVVYQD